MCSPIDSIEMVIETIGKRSTCDVLNSNVTHVIIDATPLWLVLSIPINPILTLTWQIVLHKTLGQREKL